MLVCWSPEVLLLLERLVLLRTGKVASCASCLLILKHLHVVLDNVVGLARPRSSLIKFESELLVLSLPYALACLEIQGRGVTRYPFFTCQSRLRSRT